MNLGLEYTDPRLVELYDAANPRGADTEFYLRLADSLQAQVIVDLGCGTGLLTRELARGERRVFGVDPSPAMLAVARRGPGAERVRWIVGDSSALEAWGADLAVMTGNVAQIFLDEEVWLATLRDLRRALRPGGVLAFESRNPAARAWEQWNRAQTFTRMETPSGPLEEWLEVVEVRDGRVHFQGHNVFLATGEVLVIDSVLRFRTRDEICSSLAACGFAVEHVYGDWEGGPLTDDSRVMVFVARRGEP
ncbi:MAG: class I SAM-dependent methyltransferase [Chloroflexota bacterium]|nr:MAG: class I SAM-dependent methyltransferase [Chloroflexota bacterium]